MPFDGARGGAEKAAKWATVAGAAGRHWIFG